MAGEVRAVIDKLAPFLEPETADNPNAPMRTCNRYLSNRLGQLDYPRALTLELPVGSGEIGSAHRYIIRERMKLPGAWWTAANAKDMLALRVLRGNGEREQYWANCNSVAA